MAIRVGIGGWTYEPWRGSFFPPKLPHARELAHAANLLTTIEINGTFYRSQTPATFAKWRDETPDGFMFAVKAPRFATNRRVLAEAGPSIKLFFASGVTELGDKLGPINWQFAPTKKFDAGDFAAFLAMLPHTVDGLAIRHVVEVRHDSFGVAEFIHLAREHGVAVVLAGDSEHVQIADFTAPFSYLRIMGTEEAEPLGYADTALNRWSERVRSLAAGKIPGDLTTVHAANDSSTGRDVFLYVISGHKAHNPHAAIALLDRLEGRSARAGL